MRTAERAKEKANVGDVLTRVGMIRRRGHRTLIGFPIPQTDKIKLDGKERIMGQRANGSLDYFVGLVVAESLI
jgi:hypothetical protein